MKSQQSKFYLLALNNIDPISSLIFFREFIEVFIFSAFHVKLFIDTLKKSLYALKKRVYIRRMYDDIF